MALHYGILGLLLLGCTCNAQQLPQFSEKLLRYPAVQVPTVQSADQQVKETLGWLHTPVAGVPSGPQVAVPLPARPVSEAPWVQADFAGRASALPPRVQPGFGARPLVNAPAVVKSEAKMAVRPNSVRAECREDSVVVDVQRDLLGIGWLTDPSELTLGGCVPTGQDATGTVLRFEAALQDCGSTLMVGDELVYTFVLTYMPRGIGGLPIVRSSGAVVIIECVYWRRHNVSSNALLPTWIPYSAAHSAEERLSFSLRLMADDWQHERASSVYFLGDFLNIEASVLVANGQPLRVFVDSCVATLVPDVTSVPRYAFVEHAGCLSDAKVTGSRSQFMPRKRDDKLQLRLDAFRFSEDARNVLYITCLLKATVASVPMDSQHKACSFCPKTNRWIGADGDDQVCGCCDTGCGLGGGAADVGSMATVGPISIQMKPPKARGATKQP